MKRWTILFGLLLGFNGWAGGETLKVVHDHDPWGKCEGDLTIDENGIEFASKKEKHSRKWSWTDIQSVDRKSPDSLSILTYEDQKWLLGRDRSFDLTLIKDAMLENKTLELIAEHLNRPITDRIPREIEAEYQVPVKHLHTFGGCEGTLSFGPDWIVYDTNHKEDARSWNRQTNVASVWSLNRYQLEIEIYDENQSSIRKTTRFRFELKQPLHENYYQRLRREFLPARGD